MSTLNPHDWNGHVPAPRRRSWWLRHYREVFLALAILLIWFPVWALVFWGKV